MGNDADNILLAQEADRIGYSVVWAAEAYGSDTATVLSWVGALTDKVDLGSAVMQIPARTPAMTAMTAATLDTLSGGRFRLGLGVSGPQVSEGWHGVRFEAPLGRTREYVDIVRMALRRETVVYQGKHWTLPLPDGPGKALKMTIRPVRDHLPIYLAAVGPKNLELAGEIADGWLAIFFSPEYSGDLLASLKVGRARGDRGTERDRLAGFDVVPTVPVILNDDVQTAAAPLRAYAALYLGGMGSREKNFYKRTGRPDGLRAGGREGPGSLPRQEAPRSGGRRAAGLHRSDFLDRPARPHQGSVEPLRCVRCHDADDRCRGRLAGRTPACGANDG